MKDGGAIVSACARSGKVGYATKALAAEALARIRDRHSDVHRRCLHPYLCEFCGAFHLGRDRTLGRIGQCAKKRPTRSSS
jgi:hypothetical protein